MKKYGNFFSKQERELVHLTYDKIAEHFSAIRHSVWPDVSEFLGEIEPGSLILDVVMERIVIVEIYRHRYRRKFLEISGERTEVLDTSAENGKMLCL